MKKLTANALKNELWKTLQELREDKIEAQRAEAVAVQSREIIRIVRAQQSVFKQAKQDITQEMIDFASSIEN